MNLVGMRCFINGVKHKVLIDDNRTCLVAQFSLHSREYTKGKRWVPRQTVLPPAPDYFHLGAEAEGVLSQQG